MNDGSLTKDKEDISIENLYNFIRASRQTLICGGNAWFLTDAEHSPSA